MHFNSTKYYAFLLCCLAAPLSLFAKDAKVTDAQQQLLQRNDLHFIENKGQITDQHHKMRNDIQYKLSAPGMNVFVGNGQLHYQFNNNEGAKTNSYRMDVALTGANTHARVIAEEKQNYFERYLQPQFGATGLTVSSYNKITYKDVYPNIDWVLYIKNNSLEYDFVVRPGGNANDIKLTYNGSEKMKLAVDGSLITSTPSGTVTEQTPNTYTLADGKPVASKFKIAHNTLSFDVAAHNGTIVIDPVIAWGTYYGGTGTDSVKGVATDASGNIYMTGTTNSAGNIATSFGSYQIAFGGGSSDAFVIQFNTAGVRQWATYFGGTGTDGGNGITCDPSGNVYIAGATNSTTGISFGNAYQLSLGSSGGGPFGPTSDAFVAKFDNTGTLIWATYVGGNNADQAEAVACDPLGNVYIAGFTLSTTGIATIGAYQSALGGGSTFGDVLLAKFDASGTNQWVTYYGGTTSDKATGIVCDASSNFYITGITGSAASIATIGAHQTAYAGPANGVGDAFLSKFSTAGTLTWGTYYGGTNTELATGIAIDGANNLYITGTTLSATGISTAGSYQAAQNGTTGDAYLAKFDLNGNMIWGTYYGGPGIDSSYCISTDAQNNVYIAGNTASTSGIATANAYQATGTSISAYMAEFNSLGQRLYGTYYGANSTTAHGLANFTGTNPFTVMAGTTSSATNISINTPYQPAIGGGTSDGFLVKFYIDTNVNIKQPYTDTSFCAGGTFTVHDTTNFPFRAGNTFTVQLSNAAGSFAAPVAIGTATATTSGNITCTIPALTTAGTGYRIRIVATNPAYTSADDNVNITIVTTGISAPTVTYNNPVCVGDSLKFTVTPTSALAPLTYSWTGPAAFTSTTQNAFRVSATTAMAGSYTVTTSHPGCTSINTPITVTINSVIPALPSAGSNSPVCSGQTLDLTSSSSTGGVSYSWTGPNGYTSSAQNPIYASVPTTAAGYYYVIATLNGCHSFKDSVNVAITPSTPPTIIISAVNGDTVCFGSQANFTAAATDGGTNPVYQWFVNGVAQIGAISNVWGSPYFAGSGTQVYCVLTSNAACLSSPYDTSNVITVDVLPLAVPAATITASPGNIVSMGTGVTFSVNITDGGTAPTYQWQVNGVDVPGEIYSTFTSHLLNDLDVVTVTITSNAACAQPPVVSSNAITMHIGVGVAQVQAFNNVALYPNPNTGAFNVKGSLNNINSKEVSVDILNSVGQVVYQHTATIQNGTLNEPVSLGANIADGVYFLRLSANGESKVFRFTLQR